MVDRTARPAFDVAEAYALFLKLLSAALSGRATEADRERTRGPAAPWRRTTAPPTP